MKFFKKITFILKEAQGNMIEKNQKKTRKRIASKKREQSYLPYLYEVCRTYIVNI